MWDEEDIVGRFVQGIFGLAVLGLVVPCTGVAIENNDVKSWPDFAVIAFLCIAVPFSARCLWYAVTGRDGLDRRRF